MLSPMQTNATLLVNNSQHCLTYIAFVCTPSALHVVACCFALLGVVEQSLKPVKRLATCKRTQQLLTLLAYSVSKLVLRILSFQHYETGKRQGGVRRGGGGGVTRYYPKFANSLRRKNGEGDKSAKGKREGGACYKRCFCIPPTNAMSYKLIQIQITSAVST